MIERFSMDLKQTTLYLSAGLSLGFACLWVQGPLPGDVVLTRTLQSMWGDSPSWAESITGTAKGPAIWATLGAVLLVASLHRDWRITSTPALALLLARIVDVSLRAVLFAPRPGSDLVAVAAQSASSGLPSTLGLFYGALFGVGLCVIPQRNVLSRAAFLLSILAIVAGASARIVLGGHWASQIMASVLLGVALAAGVYAILKAWSVRYRIKNRV
jgi:membrane-associated phospholipid phosphatase